MAFYKLIGFYVKKDILIYFPLGLVHMKNLDLLAEVLSDFSFRVVFKRSPWFTEGYASACGFKNIFIKDNKLPKEIFCGKVKGLILANAQASLLNLNIIEVARNLKIPIICIEEVMQMSLNGGKISSYLTPVDHLCLTSLLECKHLSGLGLSKNRLNDIGWSFKHSLSLQERQKVKSRLRKTWNVPKQNKVAVLFLSQLNLTETRGTLETSSIRDKILSIIKKGLPANYHLVIKLHPIESLEEAKSSIRPHLPNITLIHNELGAAEVLAASDVCINRGNSQVVIEALLQNVPVVAIPCGLNTIFDDQLPQVVVSSHVSLKVLLENYDRGINPDWAKVLDIHCPRPALESLERLSRFIRDVANSQKLNHLAEDWLDISLYWGILGQRLRGLSALARYEAVGGSALLATSVRRILRSDKGVNNLASFLKQDETGYRWPLAVDLWIKNQSFLRRPSKKELVALIGILENLGGYPPPFNPHMFLPSAFRLGEILASHGFVDEARAMASRINDLFYAEKLKLQLERSIELGTIGFYVNRFRHFNKLLNGYLRAKVSLLMKSAKYLSESPPEY